MKVNQNRFFLFFSRNKSLMNMMIMIKIRQIFNFKSRKKKSKKPLPVSFYLLNRICYNLVEKFIQKIRIRIDLIQLINN
jgi:hypothetical protein